MLYKNHYIFVTTGPTQTGSLLTDIYRSSYSFLIQYDFSYFNTISFVIDT